MTLHAERQVVEAALTFSPSPCPPSFLPLPSRPFPNLSHPWQFLYINSSFAPAPDVTVANLFKCFGTGEGNDGKLIVNYRCVFPFTSFPSLASVV